jgi:hypothetical protein
MQIERGWQREGLFRVWIKSLILQLETLCFNPTQELGISKLGPLRLLVNTQQIA